MNERDHANDEVVLIADDDRASRQIIRTFLEADGYSVEEAVDGLEALEKYSLCSPCVVLLDAMMPGLNGFGVCAQLERLPREQQVPVIMITSLNDQESIDRAFEAGAIDYVTKPVHWPVLRRRLRLLLQTRRAEKALQVEHELLQTLAADLERRVGERTAELHRAKEYAESILNNSSDAIIVTRSDGTVSQVNPALSHLFGYAPDEVIGQLLWQLIDPDNVATLMQTLQAVVDNRTPRRIELVTRRKDGTSFDADVVLSPIFQPGEQLAADHLSDVLFSARDITERKQMEEALRKNEEQLLQITDNMLDLIIQIDLEGTVRYASPSCWGVLGYDADHLLGRALASWLHPEDAEWVITALRETERLEFRFRHADGHYLCLEVIGNLLYTGNTLTGIVLSGRDVTARKRAEEDLRISEARYHSVVSVLAEGILMYDAEGQCIDHNASAERLLGLPSDALRHQKAMEPSWTAIREDGSPFAVEDQPAMLTLRTGQPHSNVVMGVVQTNKQPTWVSLNAQPLFDNSSPNPYAVVVSLVDVTERIQMEIGLREALARQKELTDLKSRIVTTISHEFRTPLATIQSTFDNLRYYAERMTDQQKTARMDKIHHQIQHMTGLLEDVLTLGRFDAGAVEFKPEPLDLTELVGEIVEDVRLAWPRHHLQFRHNGTEQVTADKKLIWQLLSNLLNNAGKYSPEASTIVLDMVAQQESVLFRIKDEGIGIPEKDLPHLFEAFYRAGNVGTIAGTGLGLSIVKHAVDLHAGTIAVESTVGSGTTFTVAVPVRPNKE